MIHLVACSFLENGVVRYVSAVIHEIIVQPNPVLEVEMNKPLPYHADSKQ